MTQAQAIDATAYTRRIEELDETARRHKRAAARERRLARRAAQAADSLRAELSRVGIGLEVHRG